MAVSSTTPGPFSCKALTALGSSNQITLRPGGSGNSFILTCTNPGQGTTLTIPDPGTASANLILSAAVSGSQTINTFLTISAGSATNAALTVNGTAGGGTFLKLQASAVDKSGFGWGGAGTGVGIYDYVNNSFWLQQGGTTQNKILTGNNTLDDGSGNMTVNGNSITALVVNSSSAAANSISLQYNSGTQGLYLKYDSVGGIQILDATAMVWLGQGGLTAHAVKTFTNTLDDGSGGFIAGPSGAATIALGNATGPATINLLGAINLNNTGTLASAINFGTSSNYSGTITIGNTAALAKVGVNALTPVAVNTTTLGTSALPFISLCLGTSSTAYGIKKIVQVTLSQSQIQNMFSTPVQVAAAPGGGLAIFVQTCTVNYVAGTAAFSVGGVIVVQYGNTASGGGVTATNGANVAGAGLLNAGTTNKYVVAIGVNNAAGSVGVASSGVINTGIFISNQTAAFNNSGSGATLVVTLEYLIVPMS